MRILLPGIALAVWFSPFLGDINPLQLIGKPWQTIIISFLLIVIFGTTVALLGNTVYEFYEGRHWPKRIFNFFTEYQKRKVMILLKNAKNEKDELTRAEMWTKLVQYPLDDKYEPTAKFPTVMGNILASYEEYTLSRYGMDPVFYWPRLWLVVNKDTKEEIDKDWSVADGLLYLSFVSLVAFIIYLSMGFMFLLGVMLLNLPQIPNLFLLLAAQSLSFYGFYRLSLSFHRANGEQFKALFDLYRRKLDTINLIPNGPNTGFKFHNTIAAEKQKWRDTWAYLQYMMIRCQKCNRYYFERESHCPYCDRPIQKK